MGTGAPGSALIDWRNIFWVLGAFLGGLALCMLLPLAYDLVSQQRIPMAFVYAVAATASASVILLLGGYRPQRPALKQREGILLVVLIWLASCVFGALPFYFSPHFAHYADAFFEATSGFTTTGATVLGVLEDLSPELHLWRAFSHWLGGMGIVLLSIAILPLIGQGGSDLYRAEFSGARAEKLQPRVVETARTLWRIYLALTLALFAALLIAGMGVFDAVCHAFSTMATGGFSTRTASVGAFNDPLIEYIIIVFMLLAGISFVQQYRLWVEQRVADVARDYEVKAYLTLIVLASAVITMVLLNQQPTASTGAWEQNIRQALFQVVSIVTTTGFVTTDYAQWQPVAQLILLSLMFIGGCTGSTAGGLKVARVKLMMKVIGRDFRQLSEPQGVFRIHLGGAAIQELTVSAMLNLTYLALFSLLAASLVLSTQGLDLLTAVSAVIACQFNVGPGLGDVGPASNYAAMSELSKWVLSLSMIAGRLEFYTFLFVLTRSFWRR